MATGGARTLAARASAVFPGGKVTRWPLQGLGYGPAFIDRIAGEGTCRVLGHDGNGGAVTEYIDYMSGFGAVVLGYNHPRVEAAAAEAQRRWGPTLTGPTELSVALAEKLVSLRPGAEWAILGKNGSDVTTAAARAARAATGRRMLLRAVDDPLKHAAAHHAADSDGHRGPAYHGATSGWLGGKPGVLESESTAFEIGYAYNDLDSVASALASARGDCAAIFVGGCSYPYSGATEPPTPEFARGLRALATEHRAMLVLDEIRTNFRVGGGVAPGHWAELAPGGSDAALALISPDMHCMCKALANGHPIAALVGNAASRDGAAAITASGTYWLSAPPMAAALATLSELEADDCAAMRHMQAMGRRLCEGIERQAAAHGVDVSVWGPEAMPFVTFAADDANPAERPVARAWCAAAAEGGVWLHPHHNWYLTAAHTETDVDQTLQATDAAFARVCDGTA